MAEADPRRTSAPENRELAGPPVPSSGSAPDAAAGASFHAQPPGSAGEAASVSWRLVAAPATGVGLGAAIALLLTGAAFIPDDLAREELARALGFGRAEVVQGLGLADPLGSWLFWLLLLLSAVHLLARLIGSAWRRPEALTLLGLGLAACLAGLVEGRGTGLEARLPVTLDAGPSSMGEVEVVRGVRVKRGLPLGVACASPDPRDPSFALACTVSGPAGEEEVRLVPAEVAHAADHALSLVEARWRPGPAAGEGEAAPSARFLWWQGAVPQRLALKGGAVGRIGASRRVEASWDPTAPAPLLRVSAPFPDAMSGLASSGLPGPAPDAPVLFWPAPEARPAAPGPNGSGERFEALLPQEIVLRVSQRPAHARLLVGLGLALGAAGLLLLALRAKREAA